jgi:hypothetical protein
MTMEEKLSAVQLIIVPGFLGYSPTLWGNSAEESCYRVIVNCFKPATSYTVLKNKIIMI